MIKVAVVSGKGGTGKTVVAAALADLLGGKLLLADCDVDASNLSLLLDPEVQDTKPFFGMKKAVIDPEQCTSCGLCREACRFGAIDEDESGFSVESVRCEGCGVCEYVCPVSAITLEAREDGEIYYSKTRLGFFSHAELFPGSGTSGLLVHQVKQQAIDRAGDQELLLIDGPPGIGCPVISTLSGMDAVLIVTESGLSAFHDLKRLVEVSRGFRARLFLVINRADLDEGIRDELLAYCKEEAITVLGEIPFDMAVIDSVEACRPVTSIPCPASTALRGIATALMRELGLKKSG